MESKEMLALQAGAGFDPGPQAGGGRVQPQFVRIPVPDGRYAVRVEIAARQDVQEALLFGNRRRLLWRGSLAAGERRVVETLSVVHPYLPDGAETPVKSLGVELALCAPGAEIVSASAEEADVPALLLMGDSTVTDQGAFAPYAPGATYCGWGQMMPLYLGMNACVINFARSGLTVETCREQGLYDLLKGQLRPGDTVLMQFGHNDQKRPHLQADGGYADALRAFIDELRALGAAPGVVTPLARNSWWNEREYNDMLLPFAQAAKRVAQEKGVPLIDLHDHMKRRLLETGRDAAKVLFHIGDYTHTNDFGAFFAAGYVAAQLKAQGVLDTANQGGWTPHGPYEVAANDQGDESLPPTGLEALYVTYETERPCETLTRIDALELVCRTCGLFVLNTPAALPQDAAGLTPEQQDNVRCALQARLIGDGPLRPQEAIAAGEFTRILAAAFDMRRAAAEIPQGGEGMITRAQAATLCRRAKI
ncbi:MAG: hypothetical protein J6M47_00515 [Clostridia bacterium]|nr:hypothetical protein [Clostridia bacterium]